MKAIYVLKSWGKVLLGHTPLLSIEMTRECPLRCPGCYAYAPDHLGGSVTLRELSDYRGNDLVRGVLDIVDRHKPLHVTLVGGEPMVRHRELGEILPELARRQIYSMIVTSGIIPIPLEWMRLPRFTASVSIDGLPEHHNVRRHPATYERILKNLEGRKVNIHWTITSQMLARTDYLREYARFWSNRPEVHRIWVSTYTPQVNEVSVEQLTPEQRAWVAGELAILRKDYPKLLTPAAYTHALLHSPQSPEECTFSRLSQNYSADLRTRVEPCILGGKPDCAKCGCAASAGAHWLSNLRIAGPLKAAHILHSSMRIGSFVARLQRVAVPAWIHRRQTAPATEPHLVSISGQVRNSGENRGQGKQVA